MAFRVAVLLIVMALPMYWVEDIVGVVPSVV